MQLKLLISSLLLAISTVAMAAKPITEEEVLAAQKTWGEAIVAIGKAYVAKEDYKAVATKTVETLYGYHEGEVLFKPTKASQQQFRLTKEEAISYFISGVIPEDHGFAIQPWTNVRFENKDIIIDSDSAIAMGNYYFTDAKTDKEAKVEFTFGYKRGVDDNLLINLHHSSFPYTPTY
ncbi:hypothetical protein [Beggiatoa leptomitoformis]|uniref:Phosphoribosyl-AMP cyclohydrolase n=1 Tax=Beggiatoa leptomitoformis TaxID=288004 RepID=A0A2N9YEC5_9GAMM|nr:hypothetical protein [Beggiatoa leptomitoformis]ALG68883.1 hypothetical protein AL038_15750 [Beggiatoa leptomitoformis]AUI68745.1 hypothetical protein BLE401_08510 [Beggiatoa leptomitoformis]